MARRLLTWANIGVLLLGPFLVSIPAAGRLVGREWVPLPEWLAAPTILLLWVYQLVVNGNWGQPGSMVTAGLKRIYPVASEATETQCRLVRKAEKSIRILDTYLGNFDQLQTSLEAALTRSELCTVEILLARPGSAVVSARGDLYPAGQLDREVENSVLRINRFRDQMDERNEGRPLSERFGLRYFDVVVPGPLIVVDNRHVFAGTFLQTTGSLNTPMLQFDRRMGPLRRMVGFLFRRHDDLATHYVDTFTRLWTRKA